MSKYFVGALLVLGACGDTTDATTSDSAATTDGTTPATTDGTTCAAEATTCADFCTDAMATCVGTYADQATCETDCAMWEVGCSGETGGNTLGCRVYHLGAAASDAATHCPHAGPDGGGVCI